jgi:hypothetical protein
MGPFSSLVNAITAGSFRSYFTTARINWLLHLWLLHLLLLLLLHLLALGLSTASNQHPHHHHQQLRAQCTGLVRQVHCITPLERTVYYVNATANNTSS